jgi:ribosome maturation factor RimP
MFVVEARLAPGNVVEVVVDGDGSVGIDDCVALSRAIDGAFDREVEDFELTVSSAGVGQPLKVLRQYKKLVDHPVEVLLANGTKIVAELRAADTESITLAWEEQVAVEGKKRKEKAQRVEQYPLAEVKWTKEWLDFK